MTIVHLPALKGGEFVDLTHSPRSSGVLTLDRLCCPQLSSLVFDLGSRQDSASEGSRQRCSLLHLSRLEKLLLFRCSAQAIIDLGLPASLKHLTVQAASGVVDLKWLLAEAVKCIGSGASLCSVTSADTSPSSHPAGTPWGASSVAHYTELAEQLRGLTVLTVHGKATTLLRAVSTVVCSAPSLARLRYVLEEELDDLYLPPIRSASLECFTGCYRRTGCKVPRPPVVLTFLPGCTRLRDVHVQLYNLRPDLEEGTSVKIRCHTSGQRCIVPLEERCELTLWGAFAGTKQVTIGVHFLPLPPSPQGVQAYTVLFASHATGPEQAPKWGSVVVPGVL